MIYSDIQTEADSTCWWINKICYWVVILVLIGLACAVRKDLKGIKDITEQNIDPHSCVSVCVEEFEKMGC